MEPMPPNRPIRSFKDLIVWQKAYQLALMVHRITASYPPEERFSLTDQMRRSSKGVPSDIAEGWGRGTCAEYLRFLRIARGSLCELGTDLLMSVDLGYLAADHPVYALHEEVGRLLAGTIWSQERRKAASRRNVAR